MKGGITLAIYIAIGFVPVAFGPAAIGEPWINPLAPRASTLSVLDQLAKQSAAKTAEIERQVATVAPPGPLMAPPINPLQRPIVITFGRGGKVDEHRQQFAIYQSRKVKVEVRGPCYSACTLLLAYVEPENLCIEPGAFMAFHAIRSSEHGEKMPGLTRQFIASMPELIQLWIEANGGWQNLPLNGFWTLYDRQLWQMGYPKCQ